VALIATTFPDGPARNRAMGVYSGMSAAAGFDRAFLVGSGIAVLLLVIVIAVLRVRRADLSGS
jgi:predicted small integral membrane protein